MIWTREKAIRAWKDPEWRNSLSEEEKRDMPESPAGTIEVTDEELALATGGQSSNPGGTAHRGKIGVTPKEPETPEEPSQPPTPWRPPRTRSSVKGGRGRGRAPRRPRGRGRH